jgi:hypothetical protein
LTCIDRKRTILEDSLDLILPPGAHSSVAALKGAKANDAVDGGSKRPRSPPPIRHRTLKLFRPNSPHEVDLTVDTPAIPKTDFIPGATATNVRASVWSTEVAAIAGLNYVLVVRSVESGRRPKKIASEAVGDTTY